MSRRVYIQAEQVAGDDREKIPTIEMAMSAEYDRGFRDGCRWLLQRQSHRLYVEAGLEDVDFPYYAPRRAPWEDPTDAKSSRSL